MKQKEFFSINRFEDDVVESVQSNSLTVMCKQILKVGCIMVDVYRNNEERELLTTLMKKHHFNKRSDNCDHRMRAGPKDNEICVQCNEKIIVEHNP